jgi:hypothetical protein
VAVEKRAYHLKVTLRYTRPPIWRRLEIRGSATLAQVHDAIQIAMGWTDGHLHQFVANGVTYGLRGFDRDWPMVDENEVRLDQILKKPKDELTYEYDLGDGWEHIVALEKVAPIEPGRGRYPRVTGGRRACPPEDCGGVGGFYRLLEILADREHPEHQDMLEWAGDDYDPEHFDIDEVDLLLRGRR